MPNQSLKSYLLKGGAWSFFGKLFNGLFGLLIAATLARIIDPDELGVFFLALNLATFLSIATVFGLDSSALRFISESRALGDDRRTHQVINKSFILVLSFSFISFIIAYSSAGQLILKSVFDSVNLTGLNKYIAFWLVFLAFQILFREVFRGLKDIKYSVVFGGGVSSLISFLIIVFLYINNYDVGLPEIVLAILSGLILNHLFAFKTLYKKINFLRVDRDKSKDTVQSLLLHSWPIFISSIMGVVLVYADLWILGAISGAEEVAVYGAAARLVLLASMPLSVANAVIPPLIAGMYAQNKKQEMEKLLRTVATAVFIPAFILAVAFVLIGDNVMAIIYGEFYAEGGIILAILCMGQLINVFSGSAGYTLVMTGHRITMMYITAISSTVAVVGGVLLAKSYGAVGVASAMAFSNVLQNILLLLLVRKKCGIWPHAGIRYVRNIVNLVYR